MKRFRAQFHPGILLTKGVKLYFCHLCSLWAGDVRRKQTLSRGVVVDR